MLLYGETGASIGPGMSEKQYRSKLSSSSLNQSLIYLEQLTPSLMELQTLRITLDYPETLVVSISQSCLLQSLDPSRLSPEPSTLSLTESPAMSHLGELHERLSEIYSLGQHQWMLCTKKDLDLLRDLM